jgi:Tol biopolymer transport system component
MISNHREKSKGAIYTVIAVTVISLANHGCGMGLPLIRSLSVSADGTKIAVLQRSEDKKDVAIYYSEVNDLGWRCVYNWQGGQITSLEWMYDGQRISFDYVEHTNGTRVIYTVCVLSISTGNLTVVTDEGIGTISQPSPLTDRVAFMTIRRDYRTKTVWLIGGDSTDEQMVLQGEEVPDSWGGWRWSGNGKYLIYSSKGSIWKLDTESLQKTKILGGFRMSDPTCSSPNGRWLSFYNDGQNNNTMEGHWVVSTDGSEKYQICSGYIIHYAAWSPDSDKLLYRQMEGDKHYGIWVMNANGTERRKIITIPRRLYWRNLDWVSNSEIVFTEGKGVYIIGIDGSNKRRIFP